MCYVLRNLVPLVQFKKREKHPWRSVTFSKVAGCRYTERGALTREGIYNLCLISVESVLDIAEKIFGLTNSAATLS